MEAEKDPGEQGVQVEAPAGQRSTRQPLNSTAPLHGCGHRLHRGETEKHIWIAARLIKTYTLMDSARRRCRGRVNIYNGWIDCFSMAVIRLRLFLLSFFSHISM